MAGQKNEAVNGEGLGFSPQALRDHSPGQGGTGLRPECATRRQPIATFPLGPAGPKQLVPVASATGPHPQQSAQPRQGRHRISPKLACSVCASQGQLI